MVPYQEDDDHGHSFFGFPAFPFNHDDMFRQLDEAFSNMMKNFGQFDSHMPDQEQGARDLAVFNFLLRPR